MVFPVRKATAMVLISLLPLIAAVNDCSHSLKKRILTCENVDFSGSGDDDRDGLNPVEAQLSNDTVVLMLKNSERLDLKPEFHTELFQSLNSYQVVGVKALRIAPETFANLSTLEYVKICDNDYERVVANSFRGLVKLSALTLNNNSIHDVETGAFESLVALETLELTHNDFKVLRRRLFAPLGSLKSLFLYHNNIEVLEDGCMDGLDNLNVLDLTYNRIANINADLFNGLRALSQMYLSYNRIERIAGDFALQRLEFLYLQNNKLKSISASIFSSLSRLRDVDISRNRIAELSPLAFYNCTRLMNLNYKENSLKQRVDFQFAANGTDPLITV